MAKNEKTPNKKPNQENASEGDKNQENVTKEGLSDRLASAGVSQWAAKRPVFVFVAGFALIVILYYLVTLTSFYQDVFFVKVTHVTAALSGFLLQILGQGVTVSGPDINSPAFSLSIANGCDAIEPMVLFLAVVSAFPANWKKKLIGIGVGLGLMFIINQIRVISLYFVGRYWSEEAFHIMHVDVWQVLFIAIALLLWILWIRWSFKTSSPAAHAKA